MTPARSSGGQQARRPRVVLRWSGASHYSQVTLGKGSDDQAKNEPFNCPSEAAHEHRTLTWQEPVDQGRVGREVD
jgi:hypothetical protein